MANHKAAEGHIEIGGSVVAELKGWSDSQSCGTIDDSELIDDWKTKTAGQKEWSGGCDCMWDETDATGQGAFTIGASVTVSVYPEGNASGGT